MKEHAERYRKLQAQYFDATLKFGDSEEILAKMDEVWWLMSDDERAQANKEAAIASRDASKVILETGHAFHKAMNECLIEIRQLKHKVAHLFEKVVRLENNAWWNENKPEG